jgi:hypothetical protein
MQGAAVPRDALADATSPRKAKVLSGYRLGFAGIVLVVALAVLTASLRMMSSESPVPARLYLGIEECFYKGIAVPFDNEEAGRCSPQIGLLK